MELLLFGSSLTMAFIMKEQKCANQGDVNKIKTDFQTAIVFCMDHLVLAWDIFPKEIILYMPETENLGFFLVTLTWKTSVCACAYNPKLRSVPLHKIYSLALEPWDSAQMDSQDVWATFILRQIIVNTSTNMFRPRQK